MAGKALKTVEYRRARWLHDDHPTLQELVQGAWETAEDQHGRTVSAPDGSRIVGLRSDERAGGFAIRCGFYVHRQKIGTVPMAPSVQVDTGEQGAEEGNNFLKNDFFAYVNGNHVLSINAGRGASALKRFLWGLVSGYEPNETATQFDIVRIASLPQIAMIHDVGVKTVDLSVSLQEASLIALSEDTVVDSVFSGFKNGIVNSISSVISSDDEVSGLTDSEKGSVKLSLYVPKGDNIVAKEGINALADSIAQDEDSEDYIITLRNDQQIRANEVAVRKKVYLQRVANTVSVEGAWDEMEGYWNELIESGQINV